MRLTLFALLGLLCAPAWLSAATLTWDGDVTAAGLQDGGGTWDLTASDRWYNSAAEPPAYQAWVNEAFDIAQFGSGGTGGTVTLGTGISAGGLIFGVSGYTLSGNTLTLGGSSTPILQADADAAIQSLLAGTQGFTKTGTGNLTLSGSGTSTISGSILISAGTLTLARNGVAMGGTVEVETGATLAFLTYSNQLAATTHLVNSGGSISYGSRNQTLASYTQTAGGQSGNHAGIWTVTGAVRMSGGTTLTINSNGQWSANSVDLTGFSTSINAILLGGDGNSRVTRLTVGSGGLIMDGQNLVFNRTDDPDRFGNELLLNGDITSSGSSRISTNSGLLELPAGAINQLTLPTGSTRNWNVLSDTSTLTLPLGGDGTLNKSGTGTLLLSGSRPSVNTGVVEVSEGTLSLGKSTGVDAVGGNILVDGGTLAWINSDQIPDGAGIIVTSGPTLDFAGRNEVFASYTQTGGDGITSASRNSGIVTITGTASLSAGGAMTVNSGGRMTVGFFESSGSSRTVLNVGGNSSARVSTFTITGGMSMRGQTVTLNKATAEDNQGSELVLNANFTGSGTNDINQSSGSFGVAQMNLGTEVRTFDITSGSTRLNVPVVGAGGIRKTGGGTLRFSVPAEFTGQTVIEEGTVELTGTGSIAASSGIRVDSGAVLDVSALAGSLFVYAPASGRPVFSGGGQVTGSLTLGGTAVMRPEGMVPDVAAGPSLASVTAGTLTFTEDLVFAPGAASTVLELDIFSAGLADKVVVGGDLTLSADSFIEVFFDSLYTPSPGDSWELIAWDGLLNSGGFSTGANNRTGADAAGNEGNLLLPDLTEWGLLWDISALTGGSLVIALVPEPGRMMFLCLGMACLLGHRRRRMV